MRSVLHRKSVRVGAGAGVLCALLGAWAAGASADPAVHVPAQDIGVIYPSPSPTGELPPSDAPGVKVDGLQNCPGFLFGTTETQGAVGLGFTSGDATFYRIPSGAPPSAANGGNIAGIATLYDATPGVPEPPPTMSIPPSDPVATGYTGQAHLWFGQNSNANGQSYFGETISFHGVAPDGSSVTITANPGSNTSATGNTNGWGQLKVTCTAAVS